MYHIIPLPAREPAGFYHDVLHHRCARCGEPQSDCRLNANYYDESDGRIWHVPGFCGLSHRCTS